MEMTVLNIIEGALEEIGVREKDEAVDPSDAKMGLRRLNMMMGSRSAGPLAVRGGILESFLLTAGTGSYTIGIGMDFDTIKPIKIESAYVRDQDDYDTKVEVRDTNWLGMVGNKEQTGRPEVVVLDAGPTQQMVQSGIVHVLPVPDSSNTYTLHMYCHRYLTSFSKLTDVVAMEDAYYEYLMYGLAERLWRPFHDGGEPVPADILMNSKRATDQIRMMNGTSSRVITDVPGSMNGGGYNVYTDT